MPDKKFKTIGILGGMGPLAGANMYDQILKQSQIQYKAKWDLEYPPVILFGLPLESFDETGIENFAVVEKQLVESVKRLEAAGAELIVIACNTVHYFYDQMQAAVSVPILNIITETTLHCSALPYKKIGLVSSQTTNQEGLYNKAFKDFPDKKIINLPIEEQQLMNDVVLAVMSGEYRSEAVKEKVNRTVDKLKSLGAEAILIGCTELPLAFTEKILDIPLIDSVEVLAKKAVLASGS